MCDIPPEMAAALVAHLILLSFKTSVLGLSRRGFTSSTQVEEVVDEAGEEGQR